MVALYVTYYVIVIVHYIRIYGSKPPRTRAGEAPRPRMVYVVINAYVCIVDNKCYIPTGMKNACYLSYLTFDTTSYQSQELKDKLVRMTQPALSL